MSLPVKIPKKRGRKPKGGKILDISEKPVSKAPNIPNIILHLKCNSDDLSNEENTCLIDNSNILSFEDEKFNFNIIPPKSVPDKEAILKQNYKIEASSCNNMTNGGTNNNIIYQKLKMLAKDLHTNDICDKKSACFWCTCDFDNPPIYIPKYEMENTYNVYGCFCSPECATGYLFNQSNIDSSAKYERYALLNHIYCKIYNYEKNIKPAPDPYYTLDKFYGNMTIQEYRQLLKNERLLLIVDKPLTRSLPELHEDNDNFIFNKNINDTNFKLKRNSNKKTKSEIFENNFNMH